MSQPFTDENTAFSQELNQEEVALGELEFNLRYRAEALKYQENDGSFRFMTDDGWKFTAPISPISPNGLPFIRAEELREYFLRHGFCAGDTIRLEFTDRSRIMVLDFQVGKASEDRTNQKIGSNETMPKIHLNTILYGPPGTGKTFKTAEFAVRICDGSAAFPRQELMQRYDALCEEKRISFVTFHQSYGYEDFVEGLRPTLKDGQVSYAVRSGIFREICDAARRSRLVKPGLTGKLVRDRTIYKMSLGIAGSAEGNKLFQNCMENGYVLLGWGGDIDFSECKTADEIKKKLNEKRPDIENHPDILRSDSEARYVGVFKDEIQVGDIVIASQGNKAFRAIGEVTGEYEYLERESGVFQQMRPVRWLAVFEGNQDVREIYDRNFVQSTLYRLDQGGLKLDALEKFIQDQQGANEQPFVLIIDEINRANISKVFGELITLLEPDKREGADNALTVKLPYSGDNFTVPSNLFIVGTMNTADRSIALLDTALRRRFEFKELQPDPGVLTGKLIDSVDLRSLLAALNERIEYLYDRDHTIGHAYFMHVECLKDMDTAFRRKVIPLLQEYFYEDWSRVRLALNDHSGLFIESNTGIPPGFANTEDGYEPKARYKVSQETFPLQAYLNIYR